MQLKSVFVRFYKSFNYDYDRKIKRGVTPKPWEFIGSNFYPYVEISIDPQISTIVGANESGKSHLLSTIEKGLTGRSTSGGKSSLIERKDFCRYSHFFQAARGGPRFPDFGFEWSDLDGADKDRVRRACNVAGNRDFDRFFFFRRERERCSVYLPQETGNGFDEFALNAVPGDLLPHVFRIESDIALPDNVPIHQLLEGRLEPGQYLTPSGRRFAFQLVEAAPRLMGLIDSISALPDPQPAHGVSSVALPLQILQEMRAIKQQLATHQPWAGDSILQRRAEEFNLAHDLLFKIARIDPEDMRMLAQALKDSETGLVRSVVDNINDELAGVLNFSRVWAQDRDFALRIEATEHELSFVIRDRTGRQYSFDERSSGLKHFLSYYIQYLRHEPQGHSEILLMDEPDAFLSGEAQQDLLKVFGMFADPSLGKGATTTPVQVIYVTHSPFLIDKNHAERVRALEKAEGSKGTRVIKGASQNHYEPLRSAFGAFVGETTFISGCNLMVEGPGDQILLAGAATYLRKLEDVPESEMLDLNRITIVPAGGGMSVPYLVYLARGRDAEKPAVIVMLDSDGEGDIAKRNLSKQGPHPTKKAVLDARFVLQLGDISREECGREVTEENKDERPFQVLEDLVPLPLALRAAKRFARELYDLSEDELAILSSKSVPQRVQNGQRPFEALQATFEELDPERATHIDKVPFARTVVDLLPELAEERRIRHNGQDTGLDEFEANLRAVFRRLRAMQSDAQQDTKDKRQRQKVEEKVQTFLNDHESSRVATRDDAARLLRDLESDLEGDETERAFMVQEIIHLRQTHRVAEDPTDPVPDFPALVDGLNRLRSAPTLAYEEPMVRVASRKKEREAAMQPSPTQATPATPPDLPQITAVPAKELNSPAGS